MFVFMGESIPDFTNFAERVLLIIQDKEGRRFGSLHTEERRDLIKRLCDIGFFDLRDSVEAFSRISNTSRVTIYTDIKNIRS